MSRVDCMTVWTTVITGLMLAGVATETRAADARGPQMISVPEQGLQPQALVDAQGTLHLIYYKGAAASGDVYYVRRSSQDSVWSAPVHVNSQPESAIATGTIRGAHLALGMNNRVHVVWNGSQKAEPRATAKNSTPMLYARLDAAGSAFEPQRNLIRIAAGLDGGGSVAADAQGRVYVVWHAPPDADESEANRRVWVAVSTDEGRTFAEETPADAKGDGVCGCCGLKAFTDSQGKLYVLYRAAKDKKNRDMRLLASNDHGVTFQSTLISPWSILNCPMSSAAFAQGPQSAFAAWETEGQVSLAPLNGADRMDRLLYPTGTPSGRKHPSMAVNKDGRILFVWTEGTGWQKGGMLAWQEFDSTGKPTSVKGRQPGIPVWSFAAAVTFPDGRFAIVH